MHPTFLNGDQVIVVRHWPFKWLRRDQIAVFRLPEVLLGSIDQQSSNDEGRITTKNADISSMLIIKRVIGLAGDQITTNILDVQENLRAELMKDHNQYGKRVWIVPPGCCFIKGDALGLDSTILGPIPGHFLIGPVISKVNKQKL